MPHRLNVVSGENTTFHPLAQQLICFSLSQILMAQLVEAAIEMHQKGVLHRDLKMANILVDVSSSAPRIRIIDFGCGAYLWEKPYHFYCGMLSGKHFIRQFVEF